MIVSEFVTQPSTIISKGASIREAIQMMTSLGENGLAVVDKDTLVGYITETDILQALYPTQQEFFENPSLLDFQEMETRLPELLSKKVQECMSNKSDAYLRPDSSIIHALSVMNEFKASHLPVVTGSLELVGEIHQRDIFKALIGSEMPRKTTYDYHDWTARFYDLVHTQSNRYKSESASLVKHLKKNSVKTVLDIGFGTGSHSIALAEAGFNVVGIEKSKVPFLTAQKKRDSLAQAVKDKLNFVRERDYHTFLQKSAGTYDAIIIMGHILSHYRDDWEDIVHMASQAITPGGMLIIQSLNSEYVLSRRDGLIHSTIADSRILPEREFSFTLFYDRPWDDQQHCLLTMSVLRFDGGKWTNEAINSVKLVDHTEKSITRAMKKGALQKIQTYGNKMNGPLFDESFSVRKHDWFTVIGYHAR